MATLSDDLKGSGPIDGSEVKSSDIGSVAWVEYASAYSRTAGGLVNDYSSYNSGEAFTAPAGTITGRPVSYVVEADMSCTRYDNVVASVLQVRSGAQNYEIGPSITHITSYLGSTPEGRYQIRDVYHGNLLTLYTDTVDRGTGAVKRRLELEYMNAFDGYRYRCFADGVQLDMGFVNQTWLLDQSDGQIRTLVQLNRQSMVGGVQPLATNYYGHIGEAEGPGPEPEPPGVFWTGFVNTREVL